MSYPHRSGTRHTVSFFLSPLQHENDIIIYASGYALDRLRQHGEHLKQ